MRQTDDPTIRDHVLYLLRGGGAHADLDGLLTDFPIQSINKKIDNIPYTAWQLLEHMRLAQWDILRFCIDEKHVSPDFPSGYWPGPATEADEQTWEQTIDGFHSDLRQVGELIESVSDLTAPIPHGEGQTLLREALLVADHNSYHLGALALLKRLLTEMK